MYPNMPQDNQNQPISADYLYQIAAPQVKKPFFSGKNSLIVFLLAVCLVVTALLTALSSIPKGANKLEQLAARFSSISSVAESSSVNLKSSNIRATNSNLKIFLTNVIRDIEPILESNKIDIDKLDKKIVAKETDQAMLDRLEDARLNAVFDRTYAREMSYKLEITLSLMKQIYDTTKDTNLKNILSNAHKNLEPTQKSFADFNASNS